ncbi:7-dehydrocholesterol reductase [Plakobranchus ocellatus]|uniref:7-dehydrocholesterol reductase n=1 Tax=Plakobranchus ocellatus TaxID=259542 RepID=A0AAV3Y505_9GAST|nr:7-dehydrocholesterol reductase [Plakobranchus ocellatus]
MEMESERKTERARKRKRDDVTGSFNQWLHQGNVIIAHVVLALARLDQVKFNLPYPMFCGVLIYHNRDYWQEKKELDEDRHRSGPILRSSASSDGQKIKNKNMVDIAEAEQLLRQGLGRRGMRRPDTSPGRVAKNGSTHDISTGAGDVLSEGIQGYERLTQSPGLQRLKLFLNMTLSPILLIAFVPNLVIFIWFTAIHCNGSYLTMVSKLFSQRSILTGLADMWRVVNTPSAPIIYILTGYGLYALVMMRLLPGKMVKGPVTPKGNIPVYKDNGFVYYLLTLALFWGLTYALRPYGYTPSIIYDRFDEVLFALNAFSLVFCLFLYLKGLFAPSSTDSGSSGNMIFDYYWGTELYPRILGFDVKLFTNCRFGMMGWALLVCVHAVKSYEMHGFVDSMFVSVALQLIYITKFFWWEAGYMSTIDIMVDRAGFYICWGCLVYIPGLYTSPSFYLVSQPVLLGLPVASMLLVTGILAIWINYEADMQKQMVRGSNGACQVWGRKPELIRARYTLENGQEKESLLLASGWWGMARHFHYVPEITLALCWSLPALFHNILPYSYVIFLVILLVHRTFRDDEKCARKYGTYWDQYCQKVPHKMVPYLF